MGMLPETMLNFLALLGWSLDDKTEIFSRDELIEHFTLEQVNKSDAVWDADKLSWMNGVHIRESSHERFAGALMDYWDGYPPAEFPKRPDREFALKVGPLVQGRIKTLADAAPLLPFFFVERVDYDTEELVQRGMDAQGTREALLAASEGLATLAEFDTKELESLLKPLAAKLDIKVGQLLGTLRVATTGLRVSPPIFETMEALGRDRTLSAIRAAIERL
jgi:glutamyl-tRNA synthetase